MSGSDLHELMQPPHDALLLQHLARRLRSLAERKETQPYRSEIDLALTLPWWGLRVLAIRALGAWGGYANRTWLTARARRPLSDRGFYRRPRGAAEKWLYLETLTCRLTVSHLLDETDTSWLLDLWFNDGWETFHGLHGAIAALSPPLLRERLKRELVSTERARREAAVWLLCRAHHLPDRQLALKRLIEGSDQELARLAGSVAGLLKRWGHLN
jgi:hypothetical protein